ncbi:MAG: hypothetical protein WAV90_09745, partial [Gordonia amarae]
MAEPPELGKAYLMLDVYTVDPQRPRDFQGRIRMRLAADSVPDDDAAHAAGLAACLQLLRDSGALSVARNHVVSTAGFPNHGGVLRFALALGAPFDDFVRFWIQDSSSGELSEHAVSAED